MRLDQEPSLRSQIRVAVLQGASLAEVAERFNFTPGQLTEFAGLIQQTAMDRRFRLRARSQRTQAEELGRRSADKKP